MGQTNLAAVLALVADLDLRCLQLAGGHVAGQLDIVQLGRAVEAIGDQFRDPLILSLGLPGIGLGLPQGLLGQRQAGCGDLAQTTLGLGQARVCLRDAGLPLIGVKLKQQLPGADGIALADHDGADPGCDLAGKFDTLRRTNPTAGHHGLAHVALLDPGHLDPLCAQGSKGDHSQSQQAERDGKA